MNDSDLTPEQIEAGKPLALLSYATFVVGFPLFVLPMLSRDNAFALRHAKYAGAIYVGSLAFFLITFALSFVTCGLGSFLMVLLLAFYIPIVQGTLNALNGSTEPPMLTGEFAETLFSGVTLKEALPRSGGDGPPQLPPPG